jgi:7,8-dihydropterin-6-yl-methyl-4-(beta-D-ribofuranosyl)aminobenzene 5'-phosphate synthase
MEITALIENTRSEDRKDLKAEHGLSLHIKHEGKQILFDTGATEAFSDNAEKLGVHINQVDITVISHHHFALGFINKFVGLDWRLLNKYADRINFVNELTEISPSVFILTEIKKPYPQPKGNRYLFAKEGNTYELDSFEHELIMVIREKDGLVAFTGCSHNGILNMIDSVAKQFPNVRIKAVLGGFHLIGLPILNTMSGRKREVEDIGKEILKYPIEKLYTGHCTGMKAYRILKGVLGDKLEHFPTGGRIEV